LTKSPELFADAQAREELKRVSVNGQNWPVWFYPASEKSKGTVLLVHGYRGTHHGLLSIVGAMPDFDCFVPDLPAFGEAPALTQKHDLDAYSEWLNNIFQALGLDKNTIVLGHCFGSLVVGNYAASHDTQRLVLVNPLSANALEGPHRIMSKLTDFYYHVIGKLPKKIGRTLLSLPPVIWLVTESMFKGKDLALKKWVAQQHETYFSSFSSPKTAVEGYFASVSHDLSEYAPKIHQPVLLIAADKDDITSIEAQREVATKYSDATYVEIRDLGHLLHYQAPLEVALHTREFAQVSKL
jgi:pimeloyl-ACP methyl ester carboxylesterase